MIEHAAGFEIVAAKNSAVGVACQGVFRLARGMKACFAGTFSPDADPAPHD
jgi:hypothetical protein